MKQIRQTSSRLKDLDGYVVVTSSRYPCPRGQSVSKHGA